MEGRNRRNEGRDKKIGDGNSKGKKKTRRSRSIRNKLASFKIYYINIRDIKCKRNSFEAIIEEVKPTVIAVTETWKHG